MAGLLARRPNQTVAPNGLLYDPITARGQYNNAIVANGGLLSNAQAGALQSNTGYMPNKTVGGKWGVQGSGVPLRPYERGYVTPMAQAQAPMAREVVPAPTQGLLDQSVGAGRYMIGPRGQIMPTNLEQSRRRNQAMSPEGIANTARLAANAEAYQTQRQGVLSERRANVTQNAMARREARRGRLEARRAGPEPMGLLEQMAMRDPRNAAQLLAMRQQGLLGQMQLQGQMQMQGNRIALDRELGLLNAQTQRERFGVEDKRYTAEIARQQNLDKIKFTEAANQEDANAIALDERGQFAEAEQARRRAAQLRGTGGPTPGVPAMPTPTLPAGGLLAPGGTAPQTPGGLLSPPATPRSLTPLEREQFKPLMEDPQSVVAELTRRGFTGNALNVELNKIYGGFFGAWKRTGQHPGGRSHSYVDAQGREHRSLIGQGVDAARGILGQMFY